MDKGDELEENLVVPPSGWIKINTDAAFKLGRAAIGAVVR